MATEAEVANKPEYLDLSDEEILSMGGPTASVAKEDKAKESNTDTGDAEDTSDDEAASLGSDTEDTESKEDPDNKDKDPNADDENSEDGNGDGDEADKSDGDVDVDAKDDSGDGGKKTLSPESKDQKDPKDTGDAGNKDNKADAGDKQIKQEDATQFFHKVMAPFKANGKTITLKDSDEVVSLMQMGANYTRRMQELAPFRKTLTLLQKHDLVDEDKLSFLIDLHEKNPEAIRKLVKDSEIDTLSLDSDEPSEYIAPDRTVTDTEVAFRTTLEDVSSMDGGRETIVEINKSWDEESKDVLWSQPELLTIMHQQRELGVYDQILSEIDRQKTLGKIKANMPFIQAYKTVGDELVSQGAFDHLRGNDASDVNNDGKPGIRTGQSEPAAKVVTTRAVMPKSQVVQDDRATAAAPSKGGGKSRSAQEPINPLAMSDEEFLKKFEGRV